MRAILEFWQGRHTSNYYVVQLSCGLLVSGVAGSIPSCPRIAASVPPSRLLQRAKLGLASQALPTMAPRTAVLHTGRRQSPSPTRKGYSWARLTARIIVECHWHSAPPVQHEGVQYFRCLGAATFFSHFSQQCRSHAEWRPPLVDFPFLDPIKLDLYMTVGRRPR